MSKNVYDSPSIEVAGSPFDTGSVAIALAPIFIAPFVWDAVFAVNYGAGVNAGIAVNFAAGVNVAAAVNGTVTM